MRAVVGLVVLAALAGCGAPERFALVHVDDVAAMLAARDGRTTVIDANKSDYRQREGIIPGATLLSSSEKYDVASELPKDKSARLVFYCANTH